MEAWHTISQTHFPMKARHALFYLNRNSYYGEGKKTTLQMPDTFKSSLFLWVEVGFTPRFEQREKAENGKEMKKTGGMRAEKVKSRGEGENGWEQRKESKGRSVRGRRENKKNLFCNVIKWFTINWPEASGISWLEPIKKIKKKT